MKYKSVMFLLLLSCTGTITKADDKNYLIVNLGIGFKEHGIATVSIDDFLGYKVRNAKVELKNFTKTDCLNEINNNLKDEKNIDTTVGTSYIYYHTPDIYQTYFCIEKDLWNSIPEDSKIIEENKQDGLYDIGQENVYKDLNDFTEKMKKCGLMHKIDADYLPTPETPVICDKYNEENPIPSKKIKDFY